jgi:perosamine synthetase
MDPNQRYWFPVVGFNYRMTNIAAAIGVAQLERFEEISDRFELVRHWYDAELVDQDVERLEIESVEGAQSVNWLYTLRLPQLKTQRERDQLILRLLEMGVETRPIFHPLHRMPPYRRGTDADWPISTEAADIGLSLPTSSLMKEDEVSRVVKSLVKAMRGSLR